MPTPEMFPNVDVLNQARLIYQRKEALAQQATASVPKPICKKIDENGKEFEADTFDVRHPTDIAALVIDTGAVPPDQRDEYFLEEARKLTLAFYTIDEKTNLPYPEAIKPYIKLVYDKMVVSTANMDWNDPETVASILATQKASQSFATFVKDFPSLICELYPDVEEIRKLDNLSAKASLIVNDAKIAYDDKPDPNKKPASASESFAMFSRYGTLETRLISELGHSVYDARIDGSSIIKLDAFASDFTKNYFLGNEFEDEFLDSSYNDVSYAKIYVETLSRSHTLTSVEQWPNSAIEGAIKDDMFSYERLFINGKSIRETIRELQEEQNETGFNAQAIAGRMLADALTDGKSIVTMMQVTTAAGGKTEFKHQELQVDLNALNKLDKEVGNYSRFRRLLDWAHIWKIQRFKTNKDRDAAQAKRREDPAFKQALRNAEERYINLYNDEETQKSLENRLPAHREAFPKLARAEELEQQNQLDNSHERLFIPKSDIEPDTTASIEGKHEHIEKALSNETKTV